MEISGPYKGVSSLTDHRPALAALCRGAAHGPVASPGACTGWVQVHCAHSDP